MNKKIIAREFLILFACTILFITIILIGKYLSKENYNEKIELEKQIENFSKIENTPYRLKVLNAVNSKLEGKIADSKKYIAKLENDENFASETYKFLKANISGFDKTNSEFLEKIRTDNESENHLQKISDLKKKQVENWNSIFRDYFESKESIIGFAVSLFSVFFIFRYLFYAIKWSIKQLKE